jgi:hypothetical protein
MSMRYLLLPTVTALIATAAVSTPAYAAPPDQVQGKGSYRIVADVGDLFVDLTADVNATDSTPGVGTDANGRMTITYAPSNDVTSTIKADPFCVNAIGVTAESSWASVLGTITEVSEGGPSAAVGETVIVRVIDNGKGPGAAPDSMSVQFINLSPEDAIAGGFCDPSPFVSPVTSGDFAVRDRS